MLPDINDHIRPLTIRPRPPHASQPTEVVWMSVGTLQVRGTGVSVGDSWAIASDAITLAVPAGSYELMAECFAYGTDARVARLRGLMPGRTHDGAGPVSEFFVDVASAGVIDADALDPWADTHPQDDEQWCKSFSHGRLGDASIAGLFDCPGAGVAMVHTSTGFGDGHCMALSLTDGGGVIGFELVFLEPGQGHFECEA